MENESVRSVGRTDLVLFEEEEFELGNVGEG